VDRGARDAGGVFSRVIDRRAGIGFVNGVQPEGKAGKLKARAA